MELRSPVPFLLFTTVRQQVALLIAVAGCGYAIWKGGRPERIAGSALLAGWIISPFLIDNRDWFDPQWAEAVLDTALLGLLLWLAFTSNRWWPMFAAAFHGLCVLMHLTMLIDPRVPPWSYRTAAAVWSYGWLLAMVIGTAVEVPRAQAATEPRPRAWRIWRLGRS